MKHGTDFSLVGKTIEEDGLYNVLVTCNIPGHDPIEFETGSIYESPEEAEIALKGAVDEIIESLGEHVEVTNKTESYLQ